jgi:hypothetical protein
MSVISKRTKGRSGISRQRIDELDQASRTVGAALVSATWVAYDFGLADPLKPKRRAPRVAAGVVIGASAMYGRSPTMSVQVVRALWGGALLLAPRPLLARLGLPSSRVLDVTRILGARHLAEVLILSRHPRRVPPRWPVLLDGLHAASMLAVAALSPQLRRDAMVSASAAALLASWTEAERHLT